MERYNIFECCRNGDIRIVKEYLNEGIDVDVRDEFLRTPLIYASSYGNIDIVEELISRGVDLDATDFSGISALFIVLLFSSEGNDLSIAKRLIIGGANYELKDESGSKIMDYVCNLKKQEMRDYIDSLPKNIKSCRKY